MKLPKGVYYRGERKNHLWIVYTDENGKRIKESAKTTDPNIARVFRDNRLKAVTEG